MELCVGNLPNNGATQSDQTRNRENDNSLHCHQASKSKSLSQIMHISTFSFQTKASVKPPPGKNLALLLVDQYLNEGFVTSGDPLLITQPHGFESNMDDDHDHVAPSNSHWISRGGLIVIALLGHRNFPDCSATWRQPSWGNDHMPPFKIQWKLEGATWSGGSRPKQNKHTPQATTKELHRQKPKMVTKWP